MQTRRHLVVAAAAATVVIASLAVATDMLGADVSDYATPSETIEATGTESDLGDNDRELQDQALGEGDVWTAFDLAQAWPDEPLGGPEDAPDQLSVVDETVEQSAVDAEPVIDQAAPDSQPIPTPATDTMVAEAAAADATAADDTVTDGTSPGDAVADGPVAEDTATDNAATENMVSGAQSAVAATVPLQEASPGSVAPIVAAKGSTPSSTSTSTPTSSSTVTSASAVTSPSTVTSPSAVASTSTSTPKAKAAAEREVATSTTTSSTTSTTASLKEPVTETTATTAATTTTTTVVAKQETSAAPQPTAPATTWLPVTTNTPITTWVTTTEPATTAPVVTIPTGDSGSTSSPPTTVPSTTRPSTTRPSTTTAAPTTAAPTTAAPAGGGSGSNDGLAAISNTDPRFSRYATVPSASLSLGNLTEPAPVKDNGTVGDGQFRAACQYSHFAYDDPIVYPGQSGRSHLHMFFGNTRTNADSTTDSIVNSGGGSCNGFELNRSAYWTPALLDGRGNAVVPDMIILYYKSKEPGQVQRMPQGLKMVSGNTTAESFTANDFLYWSCGDSGHSYNKSNRIPNCNGDTINATISFPQCWDGRNMDSADHRSHMALVSPHKPCPSTHPVRLPQISILMYFPGDQWTKDWHLSSDRSGGFNTGSGATLHADWWGGWNDEAMDLWTNGCMKAARNCSFGQTGTNRQLAKLNNFQNYQGPNVLPLP